MIEAIVFFPLLGALIAGLFSRRLKPSDAERITCGAMLVSAFFSGLIFYDVAILGQPQKIQLFTWFNVGHFIADWALRIDALTAVMLVVVTWVSTMVHIYSVGYMHNDPHRQRFMAYLSLFTFFMLMLVTSDNFLQLFLGWEGVGLCSYLLIGFWYKKPSACAAAIKAFLVNRVGDVGFALGIFAVYWVIGSVNFDEVFRLAPRFATHTISFFGAEFHALTVICVLLFIGAMGKSAQIGLHTWLPDAMEGPTPVSALIHAATMVTAGVFLVARCSPLFELSSFALDLVTYVGAITAVFAATIAITQNDIKKIIAYSTCSQLGYMFFACGVSAYSAGIFHLMTHAFFKALLFLGAGSVIHAMSDEQDIRKMGGIWRKIPISYTLMWIGSLALAGVFPFAGFYSKDMILEAAYAAGGAGDLAFWLGCVAAFLTAFYSWRLIIVAFHGQPRASQEVMSHIHESPKVMLMPLYVLAFGAVFSGIIGYHIFGMVDADQAFWQGTVVMLGTENVIEAAHNVPVWVKLFPLLMGASGIGLAYVIYMVVPGLHIKIAERCRYLYKFLLNKWYVDELYDFIFVRPLLALSRILWQAVDVLVIDRFGPNGSAWVSMALAGKVSKLQSGYVYVYAFVMFLGLLVLLSWFIFGQLLQL